MATSSIDQTVITIDDAAVERLLRILEAGPQSTAQVDVEYHTLTGDKIKALFAAEK